MAPEQDIASSENMLRSFLDVEHKRFFIPPLGILNISNITAPASQEAQKAGAFIQVVPVDDVTVTLSGRPVDLLTLYSCGIHEVVHMYQISHLEVMRKYVDVELAIYALNSVVKASMGGSGSSIDAMELRRLVVNIRSATPYLPLNIDRAKLVLLETLPLIDQLLVIENPGVEQLKESIDENLRSEIIARLIGILTNDPSKALYLESMRLISSLSEILPKTYLTLVLYSSYLTDFRVQDLLTTANRFANEESKLEALAKVEKEEGGDRLELAFEYGLFDHEDLVRHKENLLKIIDSALEICKSGRPFVRLSRIRQKIDAIKKPSEFQSLADGFSQTVFGQQLDPSRPSTYYFHANGISHDNNDVILFSSFLADLAITVNISKSLLEALERGRDIREAIKSVISCPLKRAPQMRCVWSGVCDHEKIWVDAISGSGSF